MFCAAPALKPLARPSLLRSGDFQAPSIDLEAAKSRHMSVSLVVDSKR